MLVVGLLMDQAKMASACPYGVESMQANYLKPSSPQGLCWQPINRRMSQQGSSRRCNHVEPLVRTVCAVYHLHILVSLVRT